MYPPSNNNVVALKTKAPIGAFFRAFGPFVGLISSITEEELRRRDSIRFFARLCSAIRRANAVSFWECRLKINYEIRV
jgi:hypothetical protein